ncbi:ATP-binding protein [Nonomuraea harbinensis]|uniref:ATP-binding protein n=1 Tax=Nonomuraea harbinensis TaxID=1286938 RepID=A0ABW1BQ09_9ACTN|nr:ATP-binding protein [Nonomuraea harbinensis]
MLDASPYLDQPCNSLTLVALPNAVWISRAYVAATLRGWGHKDDEFVDDAQLIVSELVTNSVNALGFQDNRTRMGVVLSSESLIRILMTQLAYELIIEVWDGGQGAPKQQSVGVESINGRGLEIVAALAKRWGYRFPKGGELAGGKIVWALLPLP